MFLRITLFLKDLAYFMYDKIYIINLDISVRRCAVMNEQCNENEITCHRFSGIDGYKVKLKNLSTGREFFGVDIKNKTVKIDKSVTYKVTCDPDVDNSTEFNYLGSLNHLGLGASAGEIGIWCSYISIWKDIDKNNYKNIIILEDDVIFKKNFTSNLNNFISNVPERYDLAFLDAFQHKGSQYSLAGNQYVKGFSSGSRCWGTHAIMYSAKAIKTLLSFNSYTSTVDEFLWDIISNPKQLESCVNNYINLEAYISSNDLLDTSTNGSIICGMGRDFWQC